MLAECLEVLGGVLKVVLADRMGCLKGGGRQPRRAQSRLPPLRDPLPVPAGFCVDADRESKGIVENLVGYAKDDLLVLLELDDSSAGGLAGLNERAVAWCGEDNTA